MGRGKIFKICKMFAGVSVLNLRCAFWEFTVKFSLSALALKLASFGFRNVFALSARPQRSAVTGFALLCPRRRSSSSPCELRLIWLGIAPEEIRDFHVAIEMSSPCPPDLNGLPSRASHSYALAVVRQVRPAN